MTHAHLKGWLGCDHMCHIIFLSLQVQLQGTNVPSSKGNFSVKPKSFKRSFLYKAAVVEGTNMGLMTDDFNDQGKHLMLFVVSLSQWTMQIKSLKHGNPQPSSLVVISPVLGVQNLHFLISSWFWAPRPKNLSPQSFLRLACGCLTEAIPAWF